MDRGDLVYVEGAPFEPKVFSVKPSSTSTVCAWDLSSWNAGLRMKWELNMKCS